MISIIVPTIGRETLSRLLGSIEKYGPRIGAELEVIVALDDSKVATDFEIPRFDLSGCHFQVVRSAKSGVNAARNCGARQSRGDILWFLDDDVELLECAEKSDIDRGFADSAVVAIGGDYVTASSASVLERGYNTFCSLWRASAGSSDHEQLLGGTLLARRSVWQDVGGFDERIDYGGSETSFVFGLHRRGKVHFQKHLSVLHRPIGRSFSDWLKVATRQSARKDETAHHLPSFLVRLRRSVQFFATLEVRSQLALVAFAPPFLIASFLARRVQPSRR